MSKDPSATSAPAASRAPRGFSPGPALGEALGSIRRARLSEPLAIAGLLLLGLILAPGLVERSGPVAAALFVTGVFALFVMALWTGWSVLVAAPAFALPLAAMQPGLALPEALARGFAAPVGAFVAEFVVLFVLGAVFGRAMTASGAADRLADSVVRHLSRRWAPAAVAAICALMTIGGVGVFVIAFAVYPIAREVHRRLGLRETLIPAGIALGAFTGTMTALPGAPSLTNIVASELLGTTAFALPVEGLVAALLMAALGTLWLTLRATAQPVAPVNDNAADISGPEVVVLPLWRALLPIAAAISVNAALSLPVETGRLGPDMAAFLRAAAIPLALVTGIATTMLSVAPGAQRQVLNTGASEACAPLVAAALGVGFGAMLGATPAIGAALDAVARLLGPGDPAYAAATGAFYAALVGSSSGGLYLALDAHAAQMLGAGATPDEIHRYAALGSGVLDTLPHSGAVLALLAVCRERHASAYGDIFAVSVLVPAAALAATLAIFG